MIIKENMLEVNAFGYQEYFSVLFCKSAFTTQI